MGKVIGDFAGAMTTVLTLIGDQLGLFKDLAENGAADSDGLAERTGIDERYARVAARAARRRLSVRENGGFALPPEHQLAFAQEGGPMFMCGGYEEFYAVLAVVPKLIESFKTGGGVRQSDYPRISGTACAFTAGWHENTWCRSGSRPCRRCRRSSSGRRYADAARGGSRSWLAQRSPTRPSWLRRLRGLVAGAEELAARRALPTA